MDATAAAPRYLIADELADLFRVPVSTVRHWRRNGYGPTARKIGKRWLYAAADVEAWITEQETSAA